MEGKPTLERKLTDEEIAKYLWQSFKFSQGIPNVQKMILRYVSYFTGPQKITKERKRNILAIFAKMTGTNSNKFFLPLKLQNKGVHWSTRMTSKNIVALPTFWFQMNAYLGRLNRNTSRVHEQVLKRTILLSLFWLDYKYLVIMEGRPRRNKLERVENDLFKDEHFSFIVHYLIRQNETGMQELDVMFARMKKYFYKDASYIVNSQNIFFFKRIIDVYNKTHEKKVTEKELEGFYSCKQ